MTILMIRICLQFLLLSDSHPSSNPIVRTGPPSPIDLEADVDRACRKYMRKMVELGLVREVGKKSLETVRIISWCCEGLEMLELSRCSFIGLRLF